MEWHLSLCTRTCLFCRVCILHPDLQNLMDNKRNMMNLALKSDCCLVNFCMMSIHCGQSVEYSLTIMIYSLDPLPYTLYH